MNVLGIMSGTSLDGIDYALCETDGQAIRLIDFRHREFPTKLRNELQRAAQGDLSTHALAKLHHQLGRCYADLCPELGKVELVGLHGQTVFHDPKARATLQIGEPAWLAEVLGVPVVSNFRAADLAAGGQGAPLATIFHRVVFANPGRHVCVNNLGGISNVTSLDLSRGEQIRAFDTGPANLLMDLAVQSFTRGKVRFDEGGLRAARGVPDFARVQQWLRHPFFRKAPPKSTGRELFGEAFLEPILCEMQAVGNSKQDILATLAHLTAESIVLNYRLHLQSMPDEVILSGGGAKNPYLVAEIQLAFKSYRPSIEVVRCEDRGWKSDTVEAAAFALLAHRAWERRPGNLPATTGAKRAVVLGQVAWP